ncbi:MAG: hypothetical protein K8F25_15710, partial [Fimbriimonadaceae bacterium]|nr:hypothetical protein [Alphaproteobacteria bacterium]
LSRLLGWDLVASETRKRVADTGALAVVTIERKYTAELIYYLRHTDIPVFEWKPLKFPQTHYQLKVPLSSDTPEPVLYVTPDNDADRLATLYTEVRQVGSARIPAGQFEQRTVNFFLLSGFQTANGEDTQ